jgi:uncharacterized C2H2 Zn-finger protein
MKRLIIIGLLLLAACTQTLEERHPTDDLTSWPEGTDEEVLKCDINGLLYYEKGHFIYHVNKADTQVVFSYVGEYTKPKDYPRWQLRLYDSREENIYYDTKGYMLKGELPNGDKVECIKTLVYPRDFDKFYGSHEYLFQKQEEKQEV